MSDFRKVDTAAIKAGEDPTINDETVQVNAEMIADVIRTVADIIKTAGEQNIKFGYETEDPRMSAAIQVIGKVGASMVQIRFEAEVQPIVWFAVAQFDFADEEMDHPQKGGEFCRYEIDAGTDPLTAVLRLVERIIDGSMCSHCLRPVIVDSPGSWEEPLPVDVTKYPSIVGDAPCWWWYDKDRREFVRSCAAGDTPLPPGITAP